ASVPARSLFGACPMRHIKVRLENYDWIVLSHSSGKDGAAMLDLVIKRADHAGVKDRVVVVHADIEEDWPGTKELAREHAAHYGVRCEVVRRPQGGLLQHVIDRHDRLIQQGKVGTPPWPSSTNRYCTSDLKRGQVAKLFTRLADESRQRHGERHRTRI